ncbi:DUF6985 domain-containing protein [Acinetobacter oleivorans]|uniref:DUF6985 domain-containing protein n=1 Tax=Acinetobacter oleivorans TaxID=1148157 RepID=UPI00124FE0A4|nr:hypothetical protein [Acinetobacter oleivorans]
MSLQSIEPFGFMDSKLNLIEHKKYIIFGESKEITFTLAGYGVEDITNAQERAYNEFIDNSLDYITLIEGALFDYYKLNRDKIYQDLPDEEMVPYVQMVSDLRNVFDWDQLYFLPDGEIVFMFEATFEPEMGIGVLIGDKCVKSINVQEYFI